MPPQLVLHLGYPKTATTTLQIHLFPNHPEIFYLGKKTGTNDYIAPPMFTLMNQLINAQSHVYEGGHALRNLVRSYLNGERTVVISNEALIHPWAVDIATVARRAHEAFSPCKITIVIREQRDMLWSFYRAHGSLGQYLFLQTGDGFTTDFKLPLSAADWIWLQMHQFNKNFSATLLYNEVIKVYDELFGREHVHVLLYEEMRLDLPSFVRRLSGTLGIDPIRALELLDGRTENVTRSNMAVAAQENARNEFMLALPKWFLEPYRLGNNRLAARLDIDLSQYGYLM